MKAVAHSGPRAVCWLLVFVLGVIAGGDVFAAIAPPRPNIVFILADDLGYGDLGAYGQQKIHTPNLDHLAAEGMSFTAHYAGNNVCAPSRCVLMSGKHPGHAFIRDNRQALSIGLPFAEGQVPVPPGELQLPLILRRIGYATGGFGKWGLGPVGSTGEPARQGFDRFFGFNCQAAAHNHYPTSLWDNATRVALSNPSFPAHQRFPDGLDANAPGSYATYAGREFAPDRFGAEAREFVRHNRARPFFLYYATTVPHLALQVPGDSLAEYAEKFPETPYGGSSGYLPQRTPRAAYAAMITRLDRDVGHLLALLSDLGLETNTVVIFTSDNGPLYDQLGGTDADFFNSAGGLRGRKGSMFEGGLRVPCIVRWKAVRRGLHSPPLVVSRPGHVELFDLERDPAESTDVAESHPDLVTQAAALLASQHRRSEVFPMRALDEPGAR